VCSIGFTRLRVPLKLSIFEPGKLTGYSVQVRLFDVTTSRRLVLFADISEWSDMNQVYVEFLTVNPPARSALGTNGLALGARTGIECLAYIDSKARATRD
jgi:enamine deaminase RidA (YjgF/YER057c/UK114 family)